MKITNKILNLLNLNKISSRYNFNETGIQRMLIKKEEIVMKKFLSSMLAVVILLTLLAGCGAGSSKESTATKEETKKETQKEEPKKEVTVNIYHHISGNPGKMNGLKNIMAAVEKANPGIKFSEEGIDGNVFPTQLKTKVAAGDAPDIIFGRPKFYLDMVNAGQLESLSGQNFISNISEAAISAVTIDGKIYGAPMDLAIMGVLYNKELFKNAGVEIPKTNSEFIKACETLKSKGIKPLGGRFKDLTEAYITFHADFNGLPLSRNPNFFADTVNRSKKFADYPEYKAALQRFDERLKFVDKDAWNSDWTIGMNDFSTGKIAMMVDGLWCVDAIRAVNKDDVFGFFMLPQSDNTDENILNVSIDDGFMLSAQSSVKEEALKFIEFICSKEGGEMWSKDSGLISVIKGVQNNALDPMVADAKKIVDTGKVYNTMAGVTYSGQSEQTNFTLLAEFAADQNRNVDKFIEKMDKEFDKIKASN